MRHEHFFEYKRQLEQAVYDLDPEPIMAAADILFEAWQAQKSVYVFGNGGSWSTAEHFACDLRKWSRTPGSGGVRAYALTLAPLATAYANDHDYDEIFTRQLNDVLVPYHDKAVGITCSGTSKNVVAALDLAGAQHCETICLTGSREESKWYADVCIEITAPDIRIKEDMHLAVCHILAGEVKERIAEVAQAVPA